jgi:hypothetical protein
MTTLTENPKPRKPRKAPEPVHGSARWVGGPPSAARLDDGDAILQLTTEGREPTFYHVEALRDAGALRGWRLIKIDGLEHTATYDVEITTHGLRCDCPDASFVDRPGGCKHAAGLHAALTAAKLI